MVMRLHFIAPLLDFFLFKLKTTWLGSMKELLTQRPGMLVPFIVCSLFIADKILIWRLWRMDKVHALTQWQSITNTDTYKMLVLNFISCFQLSLIFEGFSAEPLGPLKNRPKKPSYPPFIVPFKS
jgi:hypothetical protein